MWSKIAPHIKLYRPSYQGTERLLVYIKLSNIFYCTHFWGEISCELINYGMHRDIVKWTSRAVL